MKKSLLDNCLTLAKLKLPKHPEYHNFPHWTFIIRDNRIISIGVNRRYEPPRKFGYHRHYDPAFRPKLHSELAAIRNHNIKGCSIINIRLNRFEQMRLAFPCRTCLNLLMLFGVKEIYYTTEYYNWCKI